MKKVNVAVIGTGRIGRIHARNIKFQIPGAKLLAVADVIAESAQTVADELEIPVAKPIIVACSRMTIFRPW